MLRLVAAAMGPHLQRRIGVPGFRCGFGDSPIKQGLRSELVALTVEDVRTASEGLVVQLRRSKGDQEGRGAEKGIPYATSPGLCAVRALAAWLEAAGVGCRPRFASAHGQGAALSDGVVVRVHWYGVTRSKKRCLQRTRACSRSQRRQRRAHLARALASARRGQALRRTGSHVDARDLA